MVLAKEILINSGHIYEQDEGYYIRLSYTYALILYLLILIYKLKEAIHTH